MRRQGIKHTARSQDLYNKDLMCLAEGGQHARWHDYQAGASCNAREPKPAVNPTCAPEGHRTARGGRQQRLARRAIPSLNPTCTPEGHLAARRGRQQRLAQRTFAL